MKRPDRKELCLVATLLLALGAAGCGGVNASVPIAPIMFMKNSPPPPSPAEPASLALVSDVARAGMP